MKRDQIDLPPQKKTTLKKSNLIRVKKIKLNVMCEGVMLLISDVRILNLSYKKGNYLSLNIKVSHLYGISYLKATKSIQVYSWIFGVNNSQ